MIKTKIQWCDATWSPWIGCTPVSLGCANCYAARSTPARVFGVKWGKYQKRRPTKHWETPRKWNRDAKPGMLIFPSLCDPFDSEVNWEWRSELYSLVVETPNLVWLLLTKRPGNIMRDIRLWPIGTIPNNVWLGVSVENQEMADVRLPVLASINHPNRFVSFEPLLEPITVGQFPFTWAIIGGESGPNARPCDLYDIRWVKKQCEQRHIPVFVKQLGSNPVCGCPNFVQVTEFEWRHEEACELCDGTEIVPYRYGGRPLRHKKGGDPDEWPEDLRVREMPTSLR